MTSSETDDYIDGPLYSSGYHGRYNVSRWYSSPEHADNDLRLTDTWTGNFFQLASSAFVQSRAGLVTLAIGLIDILSGQKDVKVSVNLWSDAIGTVQSPTAVVDITQGTKTMHFDIDQWWSITQSVEDLTDWPYHCHETLVESLHHVIGVYVKYMKGKYHSVEIDSIPDMLKAVDENEITTLLRQSSDESDYGYLWYWETYRQQILKQCMKPEDWMNAMFNRAYDDIHIRLSVYLLCRRYRV